MALENGGQRGTEEAETTKPRFFSLHPVSSFLAQILTAHLTGHLFLTALLILSIHTILFPHPHDW